MAAAGQKQRLAAALTRSRWLPVAALAGLYVHLSATLLPFLLENNLLRGDGPGHLFLVEQTAAHLLPFGTGWTDGMWGGFPIGQLYSPLFHLLAAGPALVLGSAAAVKVVVTTIWLLLPATLYRLAGALAATQPSPETPQVHAVLLLALWCGLNVPSAVAATSLTLGSNLESVIGNGMYPSALGALGFSLLLGNLVRHGRNRPVVAALLLAFTVASHPVWGLIAAGLVVVWAAGEAIREGPAAAFFGWAGIAVVAVALCAWFVLPLLVHRDLLAPTHIAAGWPGQIHLFFWSSVAVAIYRWRRLSAPIRRLFVAGFAVGAVILAGDFVHLGFHLYRLTIPLAVLLLPALSFALHAPEAAADDGLPGRTVTLVRVANFVMVLTLASLFHVMSATVPAGNPDLDLPDLAATDPREGHIAALAEDYHVPGYMALPYVVTRAGGTTSHGISVESARNARYIFGVLHKIIPRMYTWGVRMSGNPAAQVPDGNLELAVRQLDLLGMRYLLTDRRLDLPPGTARVLPDPVLAFPNYFGSDAQTTQRLASRYFMTPDRSAFQYHLYRLEGTGLVTTAQPGIGVPPALADEATDRWFAYGGREPVPVAGHDGELPARPAARARVTGRSPGGEALSVAIQDAGETPVPLFVKIPWHPHWEATDAHSRPLPLYRAGTGMMVLASQGAVSLKYSAGWDDLVGRCLTVATLLGLAGLGIARCVRRRSE